MNDTFVPEEKTLRWFDHGHLPEHLAYTSSIFGDAAESIVRTLDRSAERTVALRKLLEAKDAAVRACIETHEAKTESEQ